MGSSQKRLRKGFTTGASVTAAATVGHCILKGEQPSIFEKVSILFPDSQYRLIVLESVVDSGSYVDVSIKKDGGDDIDITNNALITCRVSFWNGELRDSDILLEKDEVTVVLRRGGGVGIVNSDMLDVPNGKVAINPMPQKMIMDNILRVADLQDKIVVEVSVREGERLAKKTLNSILGVNDGISILGTSGIVIPCSHDAYKTTIEMLIRGASRKLKREIIAVTGGKTHKLIKRELPTFPEEQIIRIGDFIYETLSLSKIDNISSVTVVCMPGKLAKYALNYRYTHAHTIRTEMNLIAEMLLSNGVDKSVAESAAGFKTVREFVSSYNDRIKSQIYSIWANVALRNFREWNSYSSIKLVLFGFNEELLGEWS